MEAGHHVISTQLAGKVQPGGPQPAAGTALGRSTGEQGSGGQGLPRASRPGRLVRQQVAGGAGQGGPSLSRKVRRALWAGEQVVLCGR